MTTEAPPRTPSYRDAQLNKLFRELRADVRSAPKAKASLEKVETRLRFVLRVVELWDTSHAARAEELVRLNCIEAANTSASLIFDPALRADLLRRTPIKVNGGAEERIQSALEMDREVLN